MREKVRVLRALLLFRSHFASVPFQNECDTQKQLVAKCFVMIRLIRNSNRLITASIHIDYGHTTSARRCDTQTHKLLRVDDIFAPHDIAADAPSGRRYDNDDGRQRLQRNGSLFCPHANHHSSRWSFAHNSNGATTIAHDLAGVAQLLQTITPDQRHQGGNGPRALATNDARVRVRVRRRQLSTESFCTGNRPSARRTLIVNDMYARHVCAKCLGSARLTRVVVVIGGVAVSRRATRRHRRASTRPLALEHTYEQSHARTVRCAKPITMK